MGIEPADDAALEGIELARAFDRGPWGIRVIHPVADRSDVEPEVCGELWRVKVLGHAVTDGTPGGIVDHGLSLIHI